MKKSMTLWLGKFWLGALTFAAFSVPALADNIAECELVLMEQIKDESGQGGASVASYRPAADFLADLYASKEGAKMDINGLPIRAVMCARNDVIPSKNDFKILATGIPFVLSQNFDSPDSDLLTYYFKDGEFRYLHKGPDMSNAAREDLDARITEFNAREHDLAAREKAAMERAQAKAEKDGVMADEDDKPKETSSTKQKRLSQDKQRELE